MRIYRGRNPKGSKFTAEQEAEYERYESTLARVRILELGVSAILNQSNGTYLSSIEIAETSKMLAEAVALRAQAQAGREAIRSAAREVEVMPKRTRRAKKTA